MHSVIENQRVALVQLCEQYHVLTLEVFDSAATGKYKSGKSDIDLLAEFDHHAPMSALDQYLGFIRDAEILLGSKIHLVSTSSIRNQYFRLGVKETRRPLHSA